MTEPFKRTAAKKEGNENEISFHYDDENDEDQRSLMPHPGLNIMKCEADKEQPDRVTRKSQRLKEPILVEKKEFEPEIVPPPPSSTAIFRIPGETKCPARAHRHDWTTIIGDHERFPKKPLTNSTIRKRERRFQPKSMVIPDGFTIQTRTNAPPRAETESLNILGPPESIAPIGTLGPSTTRYQLPPVWHYYPANPTPPIATQRKTQPTTTTTK